MFMVCSSLPWTSLQAVVVPTYSSRPCPMPARRREFINWLPRSSARIVSTAGSLRPSGCTFRCSRSAACRRASIAPHGKRRWRCEPRRSRSAFDRTASFRGRPGNHPFVLIGEQGLRGLQSFRQMFCAALTRRGMRRLANTNFTPHVTLLYDARDVDEYPIEPIGWTVKEFVLIRSLNGHEHLVRWPLWV